MTVPQYIRRYEVIKELGNGHFGAVYMAVGEVPGRGGAPGRRRHVAIKKLKDRSNPEAARLLLQEFALLDQVKHRGVVRVFEYIEEENAVVMELVHGVTLRKVMQECDRSREQIFTEAVIEIGCEVSDALYQAYTTPGDNGEPLRLVHRDLKPENIMLTPAGEVKILDFGLARVDNKDFARDDPNRIRGTPIYMAPEQASGKAVDHSTDLFALGLIMYELLMNQPAYRVSMTSPDPVAEVFRAIERAELGSCISELESKLPGMGQVIARSLQARPANRYQNGQELLVDLRRQLYRERGACLKEFCEFFFGQVFELQELPSMESSESGGQGVDARRMSMEERLRQSMDREKAARAVSSPPSWAPAAAPQAAPPPTATPASGARTVRTFVPASAPRGAAPNAAPTFSPPPPAPARAPSPPTQPPPRPAAPAPPKQKIIGARNPDETGMMSILPIGQAGAHQKPDDPSATSFFALPPPKVEARPASPPPAAPPPAPMPQAAVAGPMAPMQQPMQQPYAQPYAQPMAGAGMIAGPIAPDMNASPFQTQGAVAPSSGADHAQRAQSNRVYAIVLGVIGLVGVAVVLAVWFGPGKKTDDQSPPPKQEIILQPTAQAEVEPPPDPVIPVPTPTRPGGKGGTKPPTTTTTTNPPPSPPPAKGPAAVTVSLTDGGGVSAVEVVCPSNFRQRVSFSSGRATIPNVPQENCTLHFKGAVSAQFGPVRGGQSLSCRMAGSTAVCQ